MSQQPIRLAIVGAGIFARDAHVPAIQSLGDTFEIVAVCSRTRASAGALARQIGDHVAVETDLDTLLARKDIDAVDVVIPIDTMPAAVRKVLASGKHLISEKPVSPDVALGLELLPLHKSGVWMVAEDVRYLEALETAADIVARGDIGGVVLCNWTIAIEMRPSNRFYNTAWRRSGEFPGGFLLDGGVHQAAALRLVVGEISGVSASVRQCRSDLPPADTLAAALTFAGGALGTLAITYAANHSADSGLTVVGDRGTLHVDYKQVKVTRDGKTDTHEFPDDGVEREFAAFAAAIRGDAPHRNSAAQALQDVAVIEAILRSSERGEHVTIGRIEGV